MCQCVGIHMVQRCSKLHADAMLRHASRQNRPMLIVQDCVDISLCISMHAFLDITAGLGLACYALFVSLQ